MSDVERFKNKLLNLKQALTNRVRAIDKDIRHEALSSDWEEQASERENDEVLESLGNVSEQELVMINRALQRMEQGEYFICSECGAPIPSARLELLPYTTLCVDCAAKLEKQAVHGE